jgi:hypothetical protein
MVQGARRQHPEAQAATGVLTAATAHGQERTLVELAGLGEMNPEALSRVAGIVFRDSQQIVATRPREILADLDSLPWPDRSGPARLLAGVPSAYMMGSRGCLGACDYCCISTLHRLVPGRRFRQRRPEKIADEMAFLYHERGVRQFIFHDDNFLVPSVERNLERIEALDRALRSRGLRHLGLVLKCRPVDVDRLGPGGKRWTVRRLGRRRRGHRWRRRCGKGRRHWGLCFRCRRVRSPAAPARLGRRSKRWAGGQLGRCGTVRWRRRFCGQRRVA